MDHQTHAIMLKCFDPSLGHPICISVSHSRHNALQSHFLYVLL
ncbi:hypothetical protein [Legionella rubrilucens]|nr:hypothetical protein [Legionella rubrilucens]